ncbi:hypothetical protein [uncultured Aquimarina sp.]|uniref:hypothetical protein n=1 Tax=uncultured Aquimarina sp. TaxID=575652 RepID=UPI0026238FD9|nr:hypothetical protein [uncultured Aquimarina sp.]
MKNITSILILTIAFSSCQSVENDYDTQVSDEEIYEFMKYIISDLKIADSVNIQKDPLILFLNKPDRNGYKISDFTQIKLEYENQKNSDEVIIEVKSSPLTVLKPIDTTFILNQNKRILGGFKWDHRKLGQVKNKNSMQVHLSLPYFSKNRKSVIILKSYNNSDAFMAGGSQILFYKKTNNSWKRKILKNLLN